MTHDSASRIVVGVDGSAASGAAVRWAVREARLRHAAVHLVHAYHSDPRLHAPYASLSWLERQESRHAAAKDVLTAAEELAHRYLPPGRLMSELVTEAPARALLDRTADAEMLVLGTTPPASGSDQPPAPMGPVARTCLGRAHCPVVVVAPDDELTRHQHEDEDQDATCRQHVPQADPSAPADTMLESAGTGR